MNSCSDGIKGSGIVREVPPEIIGVGSAIPGCKLIPDCTGIQGNIPGKGH